MLWSISSCSVLSEQGMSRGEVFVLSGFRLEGTMKRPSSQVNSMCTVGRSCPSCSPNLTQHPVIKHYICSLTTPPIENLYDYIKFPITARSLRIWDDKEVLSKHNRKSFSAPAALKDSHSTVKRLWPSHVIFYDGGTNKIFLMWVNSVLAVGWRELPWRIWKIWRQILKSWWYIQICLYIKLGVGKGWRRGKFNGVVNVVVFEERPV